MFIHLKKKNYLLFTQIHILTQNHTNAVRKLERRLLFFLLICNVVYLSSVHRHLWAES